MAYGQLRDRLRRDHLSFEFLFHHLLDHVLQQLESAVYPQGIGHFAVGVVHFLKDAGTEGDWENDHHSGSSLG
jgi:hypothetical protein